jgi:hypothetical protein
MKLTGAGCCGWVVEALDAFVVADGARARIVRGRRRARGRWGLSGQWGVIVRAINAVLVLDSRVYTGAQDGMDVRTLGWAIASGNASLVPRLAK